jgi:hypothetical protein
MDLTGAFVVLAKYIIHYLPPTASMINSFNLIRSLQDLNDHVNDEEYSY